MIRLLCVDVSTGDETVYRSLYEKASPERRLRADRYLRWEDKLRSVTADALLKRVLKTDDYQVEQSTWGKPYIKNREDFHYNLSHSGRYVVLAYGDTEVGVDVQQHRANVNRDSIGKHCFVDDERDYVQAEPSQSVRRFFEIWTGKESYLKYLGKGLQKDMRSFSVFNPEPGVQILHRMLCDGYSLSLCSREKEYLLELLDVQQLK